MKNLLMNIVANEHEDVIKSLREIIDQLQDSSVSMMLSHNPNGEHYYVTLNEGETSPYDIALARVKELEAGKASLASLYARSIAELSGLYQLIKNIDRAHFSDNPDLTREEWKRLRTTTIEAVKQIAEKQNGIDEEIAEEIAGKENHV